VVSEEIFLNLRKREMQKLGAKFVPIMKKQKVFNYGTRKNQKSHSRKKMAKMPISKAPAVNRLFPVVAVAMMPAKLANSLDIPKTI